MAQNPNDHHNVYKKDKEGSTYRIREVAFHKQIIQHDAGFTNVQATLENLHQFPIRKDDIWIICYPKSGQCFPIFPRSCYTSLFNCTQQLAVIDVADNVLHRVHMINFK